MAAAVIASATVRPLVLARLRVNWLALVAVEGSAALHVPAGRLALSVFSSLGSSPTSWRPGSERPRRWRSALPWLANGRWRCGESR